ncbi:MAG: hypothetical protein HYT70_00680 [Candidatus Aenigmarchaeota archaeon]|nr:hypothetical protein [Candidatus Aenigmarchaeota archaeon]
MEEVALQYLVWFGFAIVGAVVTFYVFGAELPIYLLISVIGLFLYTTASNPLVKFSGGWVGRLAVILFLVSLVYYMVTSNFFPENIFEFKFFMAGTSFVGEQSKNLGELVLNFIR